MPQLLPILSGFFATLGAVGLGLNGALATLAIFGTTPLGGLILSVGSPAGISFAQMTMDTPESDK